MPGLWLLFSSLLLTQILAISELNYQAVPSLVILGVAKGGTTDLWDMLHTYHRGFQSYSQQQNLNKILINPWKELDFFSFHSTNVCSIKHNCSIEQVKILLNCPTSTFRSVSSSSSSYSLDNLVNSCQHDIEQRKIRISLYTATASPSLIYSASSASNILMRFYSLTRVPPLFVVLFRNPTDWVISMYNHGMVILIYSSCTLTNLSRFVRIRWLIHIHSKIS